MPEFGPQINPEDFTHEKGDFSDVYNAEFQDELRAEIEKADKAEEKEFELTPEIEAKIMEKVQDIQDFFGFISGLKYKMWIIF